MATSSLERRFAEILLSAPTLPRPVTQHQFAPPRRWRFDFAWPELRLAVEIDGYYRGAGGGRHFDGSDREKLATARRLGWLVLHFTRPMLADSQSIIEQLEPIISARSRQRSSP